MRLRSQIFLILLLFGLAPLVASVIINFPVILERLNHLESIYHDSYRRFLHAEFHDLNQLLFSRNEMVRLLAKVPEPGFLPERSPRIRETPNTSTRFFPSPAPVDPRAKHASLQVPRMWYTNWINQILRDQKDIVQILFLGKKGKERFWLERNPETLIFEATNAPYDRPTPAFLKAAARLSPGGFLMSNISVNPEVASHDPRYVMILRLISPIAGYSRSRNESLSGMVAISIDVSQLAKAFRDTYWVHSDGHYLSVAGGGEIGSRTAFDDFPGLQQIFGNIPGDKKSEPQIWEGDDGRHVIWIPWFSTEQSGVLWVGRQVSTSPVTDILLRVLPIRVIAIVLSLIVVVLLVANWFAGRAERLGRELTEGIRRVVAHDEPVRFLWSRPQELRELGENLTKLTEINARHAETVRAHSQELEESSRYKSEFLTNVSHELRTPLNSIILLSKMLAANADNRLCADHVSQSRVIHTAAQDLRNLIDDILDLSRIDARQIVFTAESIQLPDLIAGLVELVEPQIREKRLRIRVEFEEGAPVSFVSDNEKVRQILKNFLSNAIKFTHEGCITLRIGHNTKDDGSERPLRISVLDTGVGIPSEKRQIIFEAFQQADGSTSRRYGGTGLGLTISRELAHLLGGRIHLDSEAGKGSVFSLLLPITWQPSEEFAMRGQAIRGQVIAGSPPLLHDDSQNSSGQTEPDEADKGFHGKKILIVDNDIHTLLALAPQLDRWGLTVAAAFDAQEAADTLAEDGPFQLILINVDLPEKDGYETIFQVRGQGSFQEVPIVALTTESSPEVQERCRAAGAVDCLVKPVQIPPFKKLLLRCLALEGEMSDQAIEDKP
uniref:histidine kinase n=1 Tax=Candidatus Kentrum sp. MB TaxID=2138164 RepID=A0A450XS13_9GAMM|nr:MAG: Signal transduction histidine kinase [Candidatus Kentron sp. MB]VFK32066.1 MAG: Signal transduction histidine kinase [Candidatus Kentron sp. MB]VFK75660.1 MAG: Signal transduction histidine kinase [Candidatus Kentron sp. MB]